MRPISTVSANAPARSCSLRPKDDRSEARRSMGRPSESGAPLQKQTYCYKFDRSSPATSAGAGWSDQQDVGLGELDVVVRGLVVKALVVIVDRDREHLL